MLITKLNTIYPIKKYKPCRHLIQQKYSLENLIKTLKLIPRFKTNSSI